MPQGQTSFHSSLGNKQQLSLLQQKMYGNETLAVLATGIWDWSASVHSSPRCLQVHQAWEPRLCIWLCFTHKAILHTEETCQLNTKLIRTVLDCYSGLAVHDSHGSVFSKRVKSSTFMKQELQTVNEGSPAIKLNEWVQQPYSKILP